MFLELLLGFFTVILVWDYLNKKRRSEVFEQNGFTGPKILPLIGGVLHFFGHNSESKEQNLGVLTKSCNYFFNSFSYHQYAQR